MMRYIRYAFLGTLGVILVSVSLANRQMVTLQLLPEDLAHLLGFNFALTLPLFLVVLGGIAAGVVIGFVWEWLREHKHRRTADVKHREVRKLEREVKSLKQKQSGDKDDVLALLDDVA
ncbi:LapA family protein [Ruegeria sp. PrR005]|uniref:LapA family protein n=2 Tax=Ruegeria sp. PrR005 TaxID=2706882 RepID=A0A6B2NLY2_9RHOB|nr:LapA family protein [Ruegeria sp. PrR005]